MEESVDIPSYRLKTGDEISVKANSEKLIREITDTVTLGVEPKWLSLIKQL